MYFQAGLLVKIRKHSSLLSAGLPLSLVHLVHAPERIIPGNMIYELKHNSRTIGADNKRIGEEVAAIYQKTTDGDVVVTDIKSAEMTKVVENTFRAVNIALANELAKICSHYGMDVYEIIKICNGIELTNNINVSVNDFVTDSRQVKKGDCFIAIKGENHNGKTL